jgi:hypothetical protein
MFASLEDEYWCSECESDAWLSAEKHGLLTFGHILKTNAIRRFPI